MISNSGKLLHWYCLFIVCLFVCCLLFISYCLFDCSLVELAKFIIVFVFVVVFVKCNFLGNVISPHHSDQMSQRSQVSGIALWWSSLNVFVSFIVFVYVFVFVVVFFLGPAMSPNHVDPMSQRSQVSSTVSQSVSQSATRSPNELFWTVENV